MDLGRLEAERTRRYRATPELRVRTLAQAARWLDRVGLMWLFAPRNMPALPSLYEAVEGRRGAHIDDWNENADLIWVWKNDLPAIRRGYYGKVLMGKPALIALDLLPPLYALTYTGEYRELYARGMLSLEAKRVYEALLSGGPQPTMALRRSAGLDTAAGRAHYQRALDELQRRLFILPIGATHETGAWPSQIMELFGRWFPEIPAAAARLDAGQAANTLVNRYLQTTRAAPRRDVARLFGLTRAQAAEACASLAAQGRARIEGEWVVATQRAR